MTEINIKNWGGEENQAMKGYLLYAFNLWNHEYPEEKISEENFKSLLIALNWATDDMTSQEAYQYYQRKRR